MYNLEQLIEGARDYLYENMHSHSSIAHHETAWKRLRAWCEEKGSSALAMRLNGVTSKSRD